MINQSIAIRSSIYLVTILFVLFESNFANVTTYLCDMNGSNNTANTTNETTDNNGTCIGNTCAFGKNKYFL